MADRGSYVILGAELELIKDFLDCTTAECAKNISAIVEENEKGGYQRLSDYECAIERPFLREQLAVRAVYYELWSLVERELRASAEQPWRVSARYLQRNKLKSLGGLELTAENIRRLQLVSDLSVSKIMALIEDCYSTRLSDLPGWEAISDLKTTVDAFKHRKGVENLREYMLRIGDPAKPVPPYKYYQPSIDNAYRTIEQVRLFIVALWKATEREPAPFDPSKINWDETEDDAMLS